VSGCRSNVARPRWIGLAGLLFGLALLSACGPTVVPPPPPPQAPPVVEQPPPVPPVAVAPVPTPLPPGAKVKVALLLPMTGPNGALGRGMLDAALMAVYDTHADSLKLMPHDTAANPATAAAAAHAAIAEGARLIIGPLLAADVAAVKPIAAAAGIPVLAFSTTTSLAGNGTYLLGFQPRQEIARIVAYARTRGIERFAVFAPRTPYGDLATAAMQADVAKDQGSLNAISQYEPDISGLNDAVRQFAAQGTNYDAILLPDGGARLKALAPLLAYHGIDPSKIHLLGTGLWDDPSLGKESSLVGGWYAASDPNGRADFERRFLAAEGHPAPRLATLAYDATALAAALSKGPDGPDFSASALTNSSGFVGLDGVFRLDPDGLVQRELAVLEVEPDGPRVIDPAAQSFVAAGE
jgi:ABC-type branched-subunit amino acid transport system substrate-binding protein